MRNGGDVSRGGGKEGMAKLISTTPQTGAAEQEKATGRAGMTSGDAGRWHNLFR